MQLGRDYNGFLAIKQKGYSVILFYLFNLIFQYFISSQDVLCIAWILRFPIERGARQVWRPSFTVKSQMLSLVTALVSIGNILRY